MSIGLSFMIFFCIWTASEVLIQLLTRTRRSSGEVKDRGSLLLLLPVVFLSVWAAIWWGESHRGTMLGGAHWLRPLGLALMVAGLALRWTAIFTLGRSFSANVAIHAAQTVHKSGPFRWMRHPSYTGMLLIFASIGVFEQSWISLAIMLVFPMMALMYRIKVEEKALTDAFGEDYAAYSRVTSRLIPWVF
jgi:protein-S-isoprenylcysteine O-methyltransferase Ste14